MKSAALLTISCLAIFNIAENVSATSVYVKYGADPASVCKITVTPGTDIFSDTLGNTYPVGAGIFTSAGDQYFQGSLDTATCGTGTSVPVPAFIIGLGANPSTIQGTNNATTLSWAMQNASSCSASATFTPTSSAAVSLTGIVGWPGNLCSTAAACNGSKSSTLTGLNTATDGSYAFTLTCTNTANATVSSITNVTVASVPPPPPPPASCPSSVVPAGLTEQTSVHVSYGADRNTEYDGYTSDFGSIFGRKTGSSAITPWPGASGYTLWPQIRRDQYLAIPFTPTGTHSGKWYSTANAGQVVVSMSISTCPGDFRITSAPPVLPKYCSVSGAGSQSTTMYWDTNATATSPICHLSPNQQYYLNIIQAPLTNATTKPDSLCTTSTVCATQMINTIYQ